MTVKNGTKYSVIAILTIIVIAPFSLYGASAIQNSAPDETYFSPTHLNDFDDPNIHQYGGGATTELEVPACYRYDNTSKSAIDSHPGIYTKNQTGHDYHEILIQKAQDDSGTFDHMQLLSLELNESLDSAIDQDLKELQFTAEFPRNATYTVDLHAVGNDGSNGNIVDVFAGKSLNGSTNLTTYSFEIEYSRLLDSESKMEDDMRTGLWFQINNSTDALQPGDSLKFNVDFIHSSTFTSSWFTLNLASGVVGIGLIFMGVASTPYVDPSEWFGKDRKVRYRRY